jgi:hypothetical protein
MMDDWPFPDEAPMVVAKPVTTLTRAQVIQDVEEELHAESATILLDALHFADPCLEGTPDGEGGMLPAQVPDKWIQELGTERAQRRFRTAQLALLPSKEAPVGLKMAKDALVGMAKVAAAKSAPARAINMVVVNLQAPLPVLEEREVLR